MKNLFFAILALTTFSSCGGSSFTQQFAAKICKCNEITEGEKKEECFAGIKKEGRAYAEKEKLSDAEKKTLETEINEILKKDCPSAAK